MRPQVETQPPAFENAFVAQMCANAWTHWSTWSVSRRLQRPTSAPEKKTAWHACAFLKLSHTGHPYDSRFLGHFFMEPVTPPGWKSELTFSCEKDNHKPSQTILCPWNVSCCVRSCTRFIHAGSRQPLCRSESFLLTGLPWLFRLFSLLELPWCCFGFGTMISTCFLLRV